MDRSIVQFIADRSPNRCGYCKSDSGSTSDGMWAHSLTVDDYEALLDRGWRRSGQYCYKPIMDRTCCPAYTIRCSALEFQLSKSQKKVLKKMRKFLIDGKKEKQDSCELHQDGVDGGREMLNVEVEALVPGDLPTVVLDSPPDAALAVTDTHALSEDKEVIGNPADSDKPVSSAPVGSCISDSPGKSEVLLKSSETSSSSAAPGGERSGRPLQKKAKLMRLERRERRLAEKAGASLESAGSTAGSTPLDPTHLGAEIHPIRPSSQAKSLEDYLDEPLPSHAKHSIQIKLVESLKDEGLERVEWPLYCRYQMQVHGDPPHECNIKSFQGFLLSSPLKYKAVEVESEREAAPRHGSYHQQYWLDGTKLIAVGVIDLLPSCLSSVYFFYDPEFSFLSLGTYSSLREIALVRRLAGLGGGAPLHNPLYYYMGYYIHSCPKMRYKGRMLPSHLLCPETYMWVPIQSCLPRLDSSKYSRLSGHSSNPPPTTPSLDKVLVLWKGTAMDFGRFRRLCKKKVDKDGVSEYASLVGPTLASRMLLYQP